MNLEDNYQQMMRSYRRNDLQKASLSAGYIQSALELGNAVPNIKKEDERLILILACVAIQRLYDENL